MLCVKTFISAFFLLPSALGATPAVADLTLRQKLAAHHARYAEAARELAQKVGREKGALTRDQWEALLAVADPAARLSAADLAQLRAEQDLIVAKARAAALAAAASEAINLDQVRAKGRAAELCSAAPKGGMLHLHGWGTVDRATARAIAEAGDPLVDFDSLRAEMAGESWKEHRLYPADLAFPGASGKRRFSELSAAEQDGALAWLFMPDGRYDPLDADIFRRFMGSFVAMGTLFFGGKGNPEPVMWEALFRRAAAQGVSYLEVTQNLNGATAEKMAAKVRDWEKVAQGALTRHGVTLKLIAQFDRGAKPSANRQKTDLTLAVPASPVLVGVNLVANEERYPALEGGQSLYGAMLAAQRDGKTGLRSTIHAGELGDPRNLRDAIVFGAERVGHGVKFDQDPVALEYARGGAGRPPVAIEANLQSNLRLGAVADIKQHPFARQLRLGLPVSLSTDDEGILVTDANLECKTAVESTDLTWGELKRVFRASIETSFASAAEKKALLARLNARLQQFEKSWN